MTIEAVFTQFPNLPTERLLLRQIQLADAEAFFQIKSDPEVTRRYGQEPHQSLSDTKNWIQRILAAYEQRDALVWCLTLKGNETPIGSCTFWNFEPGFHSVELGYELHPAYWGQGIMREAASAVVAYGFRELGLHRIEACPLAENKTPKTLLTKLGFRYEGNLLQRCFFRGQYEDQLLNYN